MMPNFLIIGAPRSGTTSLYYYLKHHPNIFMSNIKEPNFFCRYDAGFTSKNSIIERSEYENLFNNVKDELAVGEASTTYLSLNNAAQEINKLIPNVKI